jgi:flagellar biosynthesis protein FliQ
LIVGLIVSVFQAATQIQEQTLSFLPRFIVTLLTLIFTGHWLLAQITTLFNELFAKIPGLIG